MIPALVLTAGLATRLRPLSYVRAKATLPVAGVPLVHRILARLSAAGVSDAVLNLHHLPHTLASRVGDGSEIGIRVRYSWEAPAVLGSAGGPRHALPLLDASAFLIVNGDTLTNVDVGRLVDTHRSTGALVTLAAVPNTSPDRYGGITADDAGRVTGFVARGSSVPSFHFVGVQVAEAETFASLPDNVPAETVLWLYPRWLRERPGSIRLFASEADFIDIGTPEDYLESCIRLAEAEGRPLYNEATVRIHAGAHIERSILWDEVTIGAGSWLSECIVTDGVTVPAGTSWRGVTMRIANGELAPGERRIGELAIAGLR